MSKHIKICEEFCDKLKDQSDDKGRVNEDELKSPVSDLLKDFAGLYNIKGMKTRTERHLSDLKVRPDISVCIRGLIYGHVELKKPGIGVDVRGFKGRNLEQWKRLSSLPNVLYTDGREWTLYRSGKNEGRIVSFSKDPTLDGRNAVDGGSAFNLDALLKEFLHWQPNTPHEPSRLAEHLALLTRTLRGEATAALNRPDSKVLTLKSDLEKFFSQGIKKVDVADAIAQTIAYSLLLARLEGAENLAPSEAARVLGESNKVLALLLRLFGDAEEELRTGFGLLRRSLEVLDVKKFSKTSEMDIYFYEHFLRAYDLKLSREAGIYYTPKEVVSLQVRLTEGLLEEHFDKVEGLASRDVVLLDPAVGTGAYLIEALRQGMKSIEMRAGKVEVPAYAEQMMKNMHGIELLVGPYMIASVQLSKAYREYQSENAKSGDVKPNIHLGDTLSNPYENPHLFAALYRDLTDERENVRKIKTEGEVLVCIGNPPYHRRPTKQGSGARDSKGGWVRGAVKSGAKSNAQARESILEDFLRPARETGKGIHLKNLYNDYIYFWRFALWRLFEQQKGGGIISFITASSYLRGDGFVGVREEMRKAFDELWILDLGGDGTGARKNANVFAIRTPVAIAIGYRGKKPQRTNPARVRYVKIPGKSRDEKLWALTQIERLGEDGVFSAKGQERLGKKLSSSMLKWRDCPRGQQDWQKPFLPVGEGRFFEWPTLSDLFPNHHPGAMFTRTWPIGETKELLKERWKKLIEAPVEERASLFKETPDMKITHITKKEIPGGWEIPIKELGSDAPTPRIEPYSFRSFDNQFALIDSRLCFYLSPHIWSTLSDKQVFFISLQASHLGNGAAMSVAAHLPDKHLFRGSYGGKDVFPLYLDKDAVKPNITRGLLEFLSRQYETDITAEDLAAYVYALLGGRHYTQIFRSELEIPGAHVPVTKNAKFFKQASNLGKKLIWLHTYAQRFKDKKQNRDIKIPQGTARTIDAITEYPKEFSYKKVSKEIHIGDGRIGPVASEIWNYEISGFKVLQSWLGYRMQNSKGKKIL